MRVRITRLQVFQECHKPPIADSLIANGTEWTCRLCTLQKIEKQTGNAASVDGSVSAKVSSSKVNLQAHSVDKTTHVLIDNEKNANKLETTLKRLHIFQRTFHDKFFILEIRCAIDLH